MRTALVTGAGSGIGRGIALALARRGVALALAGRRPDALASTAGALARSGAATAILPVDLASRAERSRLVAEARSALGPLDLLVNNAGVLMGGELSQLGAEDVERAVAVNLTAAIDLTRLVLPDLASGGGSVVFIGSNVGRIPLPAATLYTATKASLQHFVDALRYELEPTGIHLLIVYPPDTDTPMVQAMRRRAGWTKAGLASPDAAGERIVVAIERRQSQLRWGWREGGLGLLGHCAPWLVRTVLRWQRRRVGQMMDSADEDRRQP